MKTITRVVVYYSDGTYQEVFGSNPYLPTTPHPYMPPSYPPNTFSIPKYQMWGINEAQCSTGWGVVNDGKGETNE